MSVRIMTVVGARPQFIKAAAVSRAVAEVAGKEEEFRARNQSAAAMVRRDHSWKKRAEQTHSFLLEVLQQ